MRLRLCPLSAHDEDRDIRDEAGQASGEPPDILSSCGGTSPGSMSLLAEKAFGFFLSPLQRLHLCVCGRASYRKPKVRRIMYYPHRGALAQLLLFISHQLIRYESSRGHKIDETIPNQAENRR